jgi:hypothetical protein
LPAYTGDCYIRTATVIDSKVIRCDLEVHAPLTVRNSYLYGQVFNNNDWPGYVIRVEDTVINGVQPNGYACHDCGIGGPNWTVLRTEIFNTNRGAFCVQECLLQDSYIHGQRLNPVPSNLEHASGARVEQFTTFTHNTLACDFQGPFVNDEIGCSADLTGYPDFAPIWHNTITNNLFIANGVGNAYCAYAGNDTGNPRTKPFGNDPRNATYVVFTGNVFQRGPNRLPQYGTGPGVCGAYGPVVAFDPSRTGNVWSGNVWDTGGLVPSEN